MDKVEACKKLKVNYLFIGDDWYDTGRFNEIEKNLKKIGVEVIYFPYTKSISSTMIRQKISKEK